MNYLNTMAALLRFDTSPVKKLNLKTLQFFSIINVMILGLIYGVSACFFSQTILAAQGLDISYVNVLKIIIAGVPIAFLMHASAALFVWVFLKATGGRAGFISSYFHMGVAAISLWPLAPFVAALQTGTTLVFTIGFTIVFALYGFAANVKMMKQVFQLSNSRMCVATSVSVIYIVSCLYLWI